MTERDPSAIYDETVDGGKFRAKVMRLTERTATYTLTHVESGEELFSKEVPLYFGAPFGPDVSDVQIWQHDAITAADRWYAEHGQTPPEATPVERPE